MYDIRIITQGTDFTLRVRAKRLGYNSFVKVAFSEIANIQVNLVSLPSQKTPLSYSYDEYGRLIIPVDGQSLDCNTYGLEITGFYNNGNWRQMLAPVVQVVNSSQYDNYPAVQTDEVTIDLDVTLGETYVSSRSFAKTIGEMENTLTQRDQDLESTKGRVSSLESAVETLPASIPTKTSELTNDSSFQTQQQVSTTVQEAITASRINDAEAILVEDGGEPELQAGISGQKIILLGKNLKGQKGDEGKPLTWDDLTDIQKAQLKGPQGECFQPIQDVSGLVLAQALGTDNSKAISQKGISDIVGYHICDANKTYDTNPGTNSIGGQISVNIPQGTKFRLTFEGLGTVVSRYRYTFNGDSTYRKDTAEKEIDFIARENISTINIQVLGSVSGVWIAPGTVSWSVDVKGAATTMQTDIDHLMERVEELEATEEEGGGASMEELSEYHSAISKELNMQKIVPELTLNDGQLNFTGGKQDSTSYKYSAPVEVKRNDLVHLRCYTAGQYAFMSAWVVEEDVLYDGIYCYTKDDRWVEQTFRVLRDGFISVCFAKSYTPTVEIWRGLDEGMDKVLPTYLKVPQTSLFVSDSSNLFNPNQAMMGLKLVDTGNMVGKDGTYWVTGFIEIPANARYVKCNYQAERIQFNNAAGDVLGGTDARTPIFIDKASYPTAKYMRFSFPNSTINYTQRSRVIISSFEQETDIKPTSYLNPTYIGIRDKGIFQLSSLAAHEATKVFGTYSDETTFIVDDEAVELNANKVYIDSSTRVLYRWDGTSLAKACMWTDRGKVFTQDFALAIFKTWHKENMIITATAKWVGETAPTIQMATSPASNQNKFWTTEYIIGVKDNYSTKEWRPYNPLHFQDRVYVYVKIPAGTTLMVDEFTNYYSNKTERGTYPMFHYRAGCGLNQGLTAWEEAAKLGYEYIIVIPKRTADGKWVVFHGDNNDKMSILYNENGTAIADGNHYVSEYTYGQLLAYDIAKGVEYGGNKLPLLEDFFALCAKRGIHPCFSVHPNFTTAEWQEVKCLADKWGVTKHLNIKAGFMGRVLETCYSVFGDDVESYYTDMNTSNSTARDTIPQTVVNETLEWVNTYNIDTSKVRVGIEYFPAYANLSGWIEAALAAGLHAGVVLNDLNASGVNGSTAANIISWIKRGVSSFTDMMNPSVGLNW